MSEEQAKCDLLNEAIRDAVESAVLFMQEDDLAPTLRDQFAMSALSGIIGSTGADATWIAPDSAAALAYGYADAMMRERAK